MMRAVSLQTQCKRSARPRYSFESAGWRAFSLSFSFATRRLSTLTSSSSRTGGGFTSSLRSQATHQKGHSWKTRRDCLCTSLTGRLLPLQAPPIDTNQSILCSQKREPPDTRNLCVGTLKSKRSSPRAFSVTSSQRENVPSSRAKSIGSASSRLTATLSL